MLPRILAAVCAAGLGILLAGCGSQVASPTTLRETPAVTASPAPTASLPAATATSLPSTVTPSPLPSTSTPGPTATPSEVRSPSPTPMLTPRAVPIPPNPLNARAWDWSRVVASDPALAHPDVPGFGGLNFGPYVEARGAAGLVAAQGYAMTAPADMAFADLDSDGVDEAAIHLFSGGTAGNTGLLIYKTGNSYPTLAAFMGGYKVWARADGRELLVTEPIYAGWEPNCCPSGFSETHYRLQDSRLVQTRRTEAGIEESRPLTVEQFYAILGRQEYAAAYAFLSPDFRAANPFSSWRAGYESTESMVARVTELPDGLVGVELTAVDRTQAGTVTRRYRGTWSLVWSSAASQWLLDRAEIALMQ